MAERAAAVVAQLAPPERPLTPEGFPPESAVVREVDWAQMDAHNHVNNKVFLGALRSARLTAAWMESSRIHYLKVVDMDYSELVARSMGFILAEVSCRFVRPVTYPDTVTTYTRVAAFTRTALVLEQLVVSAAHGVAAHGTSRMVHYDYAAGAKAALPDSLWPVLARVERLAPHDLALLRRRGT